jgi:hypothetical protein
VERGGGGEREREKCGVDAGRTMDAAVLVQPHTVVLRGSRMQERGDIGVGQVWTSEMDTIRHAHPHPKGTKVTRNRQREAINHSPCHFGENKLVPYEFQVRV